MNITNKMRLDWLRARVSYMEHANAKGTPCDKVKNGCYWPQSMEPCSNPCDTAIEEYENLDLIDYIDAMIALEKRA